MKLYCIHDRATDTYSPAVCIPSERDAIESFKHSCNDPKSAHFKHAPDFSLFYLGDYDQFTGKITISDKKLIANATALKENQNEQPKEDL